MELTGTLRAESTTKSTSKVHAQVLQDLIVTGADREMTAVDRACGEQGSSEAGGGHCLPGAAAKGGAPQRGGCVCCPGHRAAGRGRPTWAGRRAGPGRPGLVAPPPPRIHGRQPRSPVGSSHGLQPWMMSFSCAFTGALLGPRNRVVPWALAAGGPCDLPKERASLTS